MKDLNQVQKALEVKAKDEIKDLVSKFIKDIDTMSEKYNGLRVFYLGSDENKKIYCDIDKFEKLITQALVDRHLEYIVRHKTKELLSKLELI